jgi:DNA-binding transcriptional ArsR family regulator
MGIAGDVDLAALCALMSEPSRARVLLALGDGRALPAGALAAEAGVSAQAMSGHLARLVDGGLLAVERSGRFRYYRLAGPEVAAALEALCRIAPTEPVRSLRQGTRARALRRARSCYDHLAGQLAVALMAALLDRGALVRTDGLTAPARRPQDRLSAPVNDQPYRLGPAAEEVLADLGVDLAGLDGARQRRPLLRCCVDWTEQQHHLAGRLGAAVLESALAAGWLERLPRHRALRITDTGFEGFASVGCRGLDRVAA